MSAQLDTTLYRSSVLFKVFYFVFNFGNHRSKNCDRSRIWNTNEFTINYLIIFVIFIAVSVEKSGGGVVTIGKTERGSQTTMLLLLLFFQAHDGIYTRNSMLHAASFKTPKVEDKIHQKVLSLRFKTSFSFIFFNFLFLHTRWLNPLNKFCAWIMSLFLFLSFYLSTYVRHETIIKLLTRSVWNDRTKLYHYP